MLDPAGIVLTWNQGIEELLGYSREQIVGRFGAFCFTPQERTAGVFEKELVDARKLGETNVNRSAVRRDGSELQVNDVVTALHTGADGLLGFAKVTRELFVDPTAGAALGASNAELVQTLALLHVEVEHRRRLELALLTAVEEERQRLGQDLHDDLSQQLAAVAMLTSAFATQLDRKRATEDAKQAQQIAKLVTDAIHSARGLAHGLHPVTLASHGLPAALAELAQRIPLDVELRWPDTKRVDLETGVALHAYRIAEEAVGNALKHSEAKRITIGLEPDAAAGATADRIVLSITDNGQGFDGGQLASMGMGLANMKYRASAIGGTLVITSEPGKGTRVRCTVPLRALSEG